MAKITREILEDRWNMACTEAVKPQGSIFPVIDSSRWDRE